MGESASAVIVPVPEAEPVVGEFRASMDTAARWGVPAHVTVIYPFLAPDRLGTGELRRLGDAVAAKQGDFPAVRDYREALVSH